MERCVEIMALIDGARRLTPLIDQSSVAVAAGPIQERQVVQSALLGYHPSNRVHLGQSTPLLRWIRLTRTGVIQPVATQPVASVGAAINTSPAVPTSVGNLTQAFRVALTGCRHMNPMLLWLLLQWSAGTRIIRHGALSDINHLVLHTHPIMKQHRIHITVRISSISSLT